MSPNPQYLRTCASGRTREDVRLKGVRVGVPGVLPFIDIGGDRDWEYPNDVALVPVSHEMRLLTLLGPGLPRWKLSLEDEETDTG